MFKIATVELIMNFIEVLITKVRQNVSVAKE